MLLVKDTVYVEPLRMDYMRSYSMGGGLGGTRTRSRQWPNPTPLVSRCTRLSGKRSVHRVPQLPGAMQHLG